MTKIEWCDETWQVVSGCTPVTAGCRGCYSAQLCGTRLKHNPRTRGLTCRARDGRHVFTGEVRCHDDQLEKPLRWRKPRRVFVADRGDLFHDGVTDGFIDRVFAVMALCPQHTFMVLTKRPARMASYLCNDHEDTDLFERLADAGAAMMEDGDSAWSYLSNISWPLPNVEVGTSISDQSDAEAFIPDLMSAPAARRFVSYEPALGPVDFTRIYRGIDQEDGGHPGGDPEYDAVVLFLNALTGRFWAFDRRLDGTLDEGDSPLYFDKGIDQVIFGGESGHWRRTVDLAWARSVRDQCNAAGIAFFMKQVDKVQSIPDDLMIREWPR